MKKLLIAVLATATFSASFMTFAAQEIQNPAGLIKIGTVSDSSGALTLSELESKLQDKANMSGASSFRITSAGGTNTLSGTADIYR
ncbi:hypothetical protein HA48_16780 [Pantoea wallisii]|uniref:YdgH/BhsA/McbA-like domain-containing protein n=1 Tax=Pantoea wallisii TaxID=1076551 RepID=A0A1X1D2V7_9GAMM|nr:DUF1471 domain-containing protein [Pantoea wallisii]ORM71005.1 hypothetical protein HA48_16780 [Pantoea wallisii]